MALNIKSPEVDALAREVADRLGIGITEAVHAALRQAKARLDHQDQAARLAREARIQVLLREAQALPDLDPRTPDDIIGYNDRGLID